ncbi:hypothetical protein KIN20_033532 [Parelaphostrongylus tenuis]|uniref:Uncharacterized protein n=1 Tax=Parelaphostrongylus tenuis TaxID=148309 RepID=A0AAD5R8A0_PARTN|nr:hypothetical protein KIN20_033532 [Parelaphostrongylus tenuis]
MANTQMLLDRLRNANQIMRSYWSHFTSLLSIPTNNCKAITYDLNRYDYENQRRKKRL